MRYVLTLGSVVVVAFIAFVFWYRWDSGKNRGLAYGYYGEFNTVSNRLSKLPGVTIIKSWHNADVILEEFGFKIFSHSQQLDLAFRERDPIRKLSGVDLEKALLEMIKKQSVNTNI